MCPLTKFQNRLAHAIQWRTDSAHASFNTFIAQHLVALRWKTKTTAPKHTLNGPLIISLTSYPPRFPTLALTLKSLLTQSIAPDKTILWISHADMAQLPASVTALQSHGLEIRPTDDLRSYKKIIPLLEETQDAYICTADDDVYYRKHWLAELTASAAPGKITAHRAHEIKPHSSGAYAPYSDWHFDTPARTSSPHLFPTGAGGVLYPPHAFPPEVLNRESFMRLCPQGDDIWLYWMGRKANNAYQTIGKRRDLITWSGSQDVALHNDNLNSGNDTQINAIAAEYGYPAV